MASSKGNNTPQPHSLSDLEAKYYYYGLYSKPVLVARTGNDTWVRPTGPEAYLRLKELRTVGNHSLKGVWEDNLAFKIHNILEQKGVQWTSTDVARIGFVGESFAPVRIWIGVKPETLSREDGLTIAKECKEVLIANNIQDVEVEIRESVVTHYTGPMLRKPVRSTDPTAQLVEPLTSTLGPFICNVSTPNIEGTGGFYVTDSASNLYLVTARHVVFKPDLKSNETYEYGSKKSGQPRVNIALLGEAAFTKYLLQIKQAITDQNIIIDFQERLANDAMEGDEMDVEEAVEEYEAAKKNVEEAKKTRVALEKLYNEVEKGWSKIDNRVLGYVQFSPPIKLNAVGPSIGPAVGPAVGPTIESAPSHQKFTQDYALIRIDKSKIDARNFTGNTIDLGTQMTTHEFTKLMYPHPANRHSFKFPTNRLLNVQGTISIDEMCNPTMLDENGDPCLIVLKRGNTTGLTLGRANNILSFVRNYFDGILQTSTEWPIYPYNSKSGAFSDKGDSGAAVIDCCGRLGGLLTGGNGITDSGDITYATPISCIMDSLQQNKYYVTTEATLTS